MENELEGQLAALETRAAKLQHWTRLSVQVEQQEVLGLEAAAAALQQQQQQLQQQRLSALPAIEKAAAAELKQIKQQRETVLEHLRAEGEKLINSLCLFHKNKERSWEAAVPPTKAKEKCRELWASLAHVKSTRETAADALTAKLNDALGEAEKAIYEESASRRQAEEALNG
ncbi:hypothetical protein, conserved, partial [Eimeria tenella]